MRTRTGRSVAILLFVALAFAALVEDRTSRNARTFRILASASRWETRPETGENGGTITNFAASSSQGGSDLIVLTERGMLRWATGVRKIIRISLADAPTFIVTRQRIRALEVFPGVSLRLIAGALMLSALCLALPPLVTRRHRATRGLCLGCGYDTRGNTSGRCPECGAIVAQVRSAGVQNVDRRPERPASGS